MLKKHVS